LDFLRANELMDVSLERRVCAILWGIVGKTLRGSVAACHVRGTTANASQVSFENQRAVNAPQATRVKNGSDELKD